MIWWPKVISLGLSPWQPKIKVAELVVLVVFVPLSLRQMRDAGALWLTTIFGRTIPPNSNWNNLRNAIDGSNSVHISLPYCSKEFLSRYQAWSGTTFTYMVSCSNGLYPTGILMRIINKKLLIRKDCFSRSCRYIDRHTVFRNTNDIFFRASHKKISWSPNSTVNPWSWIISHGLKTNLHWFKAWTAK